MWATVLHICNSMYSCLDERTNALTTAHSMRMIESRGRLMPARPTWVLPKGPRHVLFILNTGKFQRIYAFFAFHAVEHQD